MSGPRPESNFLIRNFLADAYTEVIEIHAYITAGTYCHTNSMRKQITYKMSALGRAMVSRTTRQKNLHCKNKSVVLTAELLP